MRKKAKILRWLLVFLVVGLVGVAYWEFFLKKNQVISEEVDCDPYSEKCFIWKCNPTSTAEEEKCTGDSEVDVWYYKIAKRKEVNVPLCDPEEDEDCLSFQCAENEVDCGEILCDEKTKVEQKMECSDPEQYTKDNPPVDNESLDAECALDDQECLDEANMDESDECTLDDQECLIEGEEEDAPEIENITNEIEES